MKKIENQHSVFSISWWICIIATALFTASCSTEPISAQRVRGPAIIYVRDAGVLGSACSYDIYLDEKVIGHLGAGESLSKAVQNGRHRVAIENVTLACPNIKMSKVVEVIDSPVVLRIGFTSTFQTIFDQVE